MTYQEIARLIRAGAALRPQCKGGMFKGEYAQPGLRSCALGALHEAWFGETVHRDPRTSPLEGLLTTFPLLKRPVSVFLLPPALRAHWREIRQSLGNMEGEGFAVADNIIALNDHLGWTREAIADWVETLDCREPLEVEVDEALVPA